MLFVELSCHLISPFTGINFIVVLLSLSFLLYLFLFHFIFLNLFNFLRFLLLFFFLLFMLSKNLSNGRTDFSVLLFLFFNNLLFFFFLWLWRRHLCSILLLLLLQLNHGFLCHSVLNSLLYLFRISIVILLVHLHHRVPCHSFWQILTKKLKLLVLAVSRKMKHQFSIFRKFRLIVRVFLSLFGFCFISNRVKRVILKIKHFLSFKSLKIRFSEVFRSILASDSFILFSSYSVILDLSDYIMSLLFGSLFDSKHFLSIFK